MDHGILIVDDQRDILKLLRSTIESLKNKELKIFEAPSGEEALLESSRHKIDLLISDYKLPGMTGVELMHKVRARHPDVKVILVTGMTERKIRDEILNAGAAAIFDKPIPLADFLDSVERNLGLVQTIFPPEKPKAGDENTQQRHMRVSDLLTNFRQDIKAQAVFLLNDRGLIQARAGSLRDSSTEVSLISAITAVHAASLKVAHYNHQNNPAAYYHVFQGGDHDLLLIPVTPQYALMVAGEKLVEENRIIETITGLLALAREVEKSLKSLGVTGELKTEKKPASPSKPAPVSTPQADPLADVLSAAPAPEMEALFSQNKAKAPANVDDFWNQAAEAHAKKPTSGEVISLEEARKMGLLPDDEKK